MLAKFDIDYSIPFADGAQIHHHCANDSADCEDFLANLLEHNFIIQGIRHEGVDLVNGKFDGMIKTAAGVMAARHICAALGIDSVEACRRFSLPA
jgi:hypothetical protein